MLSLERYLFTTSLTDTTIQDGGKRERNSILNSNSKSKK